jgi:RIO kinase 1
MARRLGKRKQKRREDYVLKEQNKVDEGIFDTKTMIYLSKFINKGVISRLSYPIARGKEADVYVADPGSSDFVKGMDLVVVKFFRVETSSFFKMEEYVAGDRRFSQRKTGLSKLGIVLWWCKKEYLNLLVAARAGVRAPIPLMFNGSILAMSFIGTDSVPAPRLKDCALENPEEVLDEILEDVALLYGKNLVHADLSEYNILMHNGHPYLIDFGQAVIIDHPHSFSFLKRDIVNITSYFRRRYEVDRDAESAYNLILESAKMQGRRTRSTP